jgi:sugar/nucleoside kinase (ribokinase family)
MSYYAAQDVQLPKPKIGKWRRTIGAACFVFAGLLLGIALGSASTADGSNAECAALANEYAALVSDALDAGLSGDEARMLDVAEQRDALGAQVKNFC